MKAHCNAFRLVATVTVVSLVSFALLPNLWQSGVVHAGSDLGSQAQEFSPTTPQGVCNNFTDAPAHEYFCSALMRVMSAGAIGGYNTNPPCTSGVPCFRPYDNVTRGQFSKVLVLYFGWAINTSGGPHFVDVPPGSTFYNYIETAYNRGLISGYNTNPPCTTGIPCFAPNNSISRGQMAKMLSNAAEFTDNTAGRTPSFYDVPSNDPFFVYIERLVMHAVASQYPPGAYPQPVCGSTIQPCFFTYSQALRADAVVHIDVANARWVNNPNTSRHFNNGQVFASEGGPYPRHDGVWVYMTTPDATLYSGQWQAGPVGVSDRYNGHFIESGPQKKCDPFCNIHPYGTWGDSATSGYYWNTNVNLGGGLTYAYQSVYFGGTGGQWQAQFCSSGCQGMVTSGDLGFALAFATAGGETNDLSVRFGSITASQAQARTNGTWSYWCYNSALTPWRTLNGSISSCSNSSWTVNY